MDVATCSRWFLAQLIFDPEDGGDMFLENISSYTDYAVLNPRRWQFSLDGCLWLLVWTSSL
jgi:hypothetical protein